MTMLPQLMASLNLVLGTTITTSSHHWLLAWAGLELSMLSMLVLIAKPKHPRAAEAATKYFLTQVIASTLMLFSSMVNALQTGQWNIPQMTDKYACTMLLLALTLKIGAAPMYFWLPEVMQGTSTMAAMTVATWQKVAPITILFTVYDHLPPKIMTTIGVMSIIIGGLGSINQTQLRKLMAYSSITNLGWAMTVFAATPHIATLNILIYMSMLFPAFMFIQKMSLKTLQDSATAWTTSPTMNTTLMLMLLSLSGLPPFAGFVTKLMILNELITQGSTTTALMVAVLSLIGLFFYLRMTYIITMTTPPIMTPATMKWRLSPKKLKLMAALVPLSLLTIPLLLPLLMSMT
uniref:NADH-ubiquinone oxidoreductase chain 2 n=1 Tax=Bradypodion sp. matschiei TaxID=419434 RepID=A7WM53_9SAUR|nr:NADH dehydrogenase subunit 2 [Bradypodion sp. matschiei]